SLCCTVLLTLGNSLIQLSQRLAQNCTVLQAKFSARRKDREKFSTLVHALLSLSLSLSLSRDESDGTRTPAAIALLERNIASRILSRNPGRDRQITRNRPEVGIQILPPPAA